MRELALLLEDGTVIRDPEWLCVADILRAFHAFDTRVVYGTIVCAETLAPMYLTEQLIDGSRSGTD